MTVAKVVPIRILNAAIDETPRGEIVLRGVVDPKCLHLLQVDDYQREAAPLTALSSILQALKDDETLPDIELGMRGERYQSDGKGESHTTHILLDPTFIIDGLQRVNGAKHFLNTNPERAVRLGATVHFGTNREWERERFRILNTLRKKVSPNVLLRNQREASPAIGMLHSLTAGDRTFVLNRRVSWKQRMTRGDLLTALNVLKTVGVLHSHKAPTKQNAVAKLVPAVDRALEIVGVQNMRDNVRTFFDLVDECWGIKRVEYREGAAYIKGNFLRVLAMVLSDHLDFWRQPDEKKLVIEAPLRRKIALFPVHDPQVVSLASGTGKARDMLYMMLRDHINSGKRTKRLRSRTGEHISFEDEGEGDED